MTTSTIRDNYVHGKNLATVINGSLTTNPCIGGSKVRDSGVYEITMTWSLRSSDVSTGANPHLYIGFGTFVNNQSTANPTHHTLVRPGATNTNTTQNYPYQGEIKCWVVKPDDVEMDFFMTESIATTWYMYNINAVAKKIADL